ncbi:MAG: DUF2807 domain-containing protein [Parvularculaceae bacterium]|nr:DUF2807 domain-containing protein [Parvularculaceae bacterium]
MKRLIPAIPFAMAFCLSAAVADQTTEKSYDYKGFKQVEVAGVFDLKIEVGPDYSIRLSGPSDEMEKVQTTLSGQSLILDTKDESRRKDRKSRRNGVKAVVILPDLHALDISGVVDAEVSGLDSADFSLELSGVGDVEISGRCDKFHANVSGVGELDAGGFECKAVDVNVSGVGEAKVYAADSVDARISGIGEISVYGAPSIIRKQDSLFSKITIVE